MKAQLINDHFQNFKRYGIPKAQLVLADIPYNLGNNAYASNPSWYVDGDNKNGESEKAGKEFFDTDKDFRPAEFMHFCSTMLKKEPKEKKSAPCMIVTTVADDSHSHTGATISALDAGSVTTGTFNIARIPTGTTHTTGVCRRFQVTTDQYHQSYTNSFMFAANISS